MLSYSSENILWNKVTEMTEKAKKILRKVIE
jgi:hypothetical protein